MRVSHSGTPNLHVLVILIHFWPTSESCRQATTKDMDFIFPVLALPARTYQASKYEGMDMHSLATVLCQSLVRISLKSGNLQVKMSYSD